MPDWKPLLAARLARLALRPAREREIIDELSQHLDDRYEELRTAGSTPDAAMRSAIDEIEDEDLLAREMRPLRQASPPEPIAAGAPRHGLVRDAWQDLVYAARMLRKNPGFAPRRSSPWRSASARTPRSSVSSTPRCSSGSRSRIAIAWTTSSTARTGASCRIPPTRRCVTARNSSTASRRGAG